MARRFPGRWSSDGEPSSSSSRPVNPDSSQLPPAHRSQSAPPQAHSLFGCLGIPQFPVWAARQSDPLLNLRPLLIHYKGKVLSASTDCLSRGVRLDWTLARAQSLCPEARDLVHDPAEVAAAWEEILRSLYHLTPKIQSIRPGLAFFEPPSPGASSHQSIMGALAKMAVGVEGRMAIAADRATAELLAHTIKPGTLRCLPAASQDNLLEKIPVCRLCLIGLSEYSIERLKWFGLETVIKLRSISREQIASQFFNRKAPADAALIWRFACAGTDAADREPVSTYTSAPTRHARLVFKQAATCQAEWELALRDIIQQAASDLNGMGVGGLRLVVETNRGQIQCTKLLRESVSSSRTLIRIATELLLSRLASQKKRIELQTIEIVLTNLVAHGVQDTLFDTTRLDAAHLQKGKAKAKRGRSQPNSSRQGKHSSNLRPCPPRLKTAVENIESRFPQSLYRCLLQNPHATLPEEQYCFAPVTFDSSKRR